MMVFDPSMKSDGKFVDVADIVPGKENFRIKVRVIRMWKASGFADSKGSASIEMVFRDEKGAKIHCSVRKQFVGMFEPQLVEGRVYEICDLSVFPQNGLYRTTLHPYKLSFQSKTVVTPSDSSSIPEYGLSLVDISEVSSHNHEYEYLVDVAGVMTGMSVVRELGKDGKGSKMMVVELTDHSGKIECALFGDYVDDLKRKMGKTSPGLPVVVVQFAKVKRYRDKVSIQNVMNATRILVNPSNPEVEFFRNRIAVSGFEGEVSVPLIGSPPRPSLEEEFLRMHPRKTVAELVRSDGEGVFVVCAKVVGVVEGSRWWYTACKCQMAVFPDSDSFFCGGCGRNVFQVVPRYRVKFEVTDGQALCVFVLFDSDMNYLIGRSCAFFVGQSKGKGIGDYPIEFDGLLGKMMLFVVNKTGEASPAGLSSFTVKRVCADTAIIRKFCADGYLRSPSEAISPSVDEELEILSDDSMAGDDGNEAEFVENVILASPLTTVAPGDDAGSSFVVERRVCEDGQDSKGVQSAKDVNVDGNLDRGFVVDAVLGEVVVGDDGESCLVKRNMSKDVQDPPVVEFVKSCNVGGEVFAENRNLSKNDRNAPPVQINKGCDVGGERSVVMLDLSTDADDSEDVPFVVKRNLSRAFDGAAKPKRGGRLKKVKIEKE